MKKRFLIVTVPVTNLRERPMEASFEYIHDDLQKTQLLYNEILLHRDESEGWYCVEAVEQKKAVSQGGWQGYPGWIKKESAVFIDERPPFNAVVQHTRTTIMKAPEGKAASLFPLSIGTRLVIEDRGDEDYYKTILADETKGWIKKGAVNSLKAMDDVSRLRQNIIEIGKSFLGMPYLWGGRSAYIPIGDRGIPNTEPGTGFTTVTGVDCSGLTNLAYRVNHMDIPRDAHDQWIMAAEILPEKCEPADLVFVSAEGERDKITHVMLYMGSEEFIEASETGSIVAINTFEKKFGFTLHDMAKQGFVVNKRRIYFGSILSAPYKKWMK
jgi:cell wall-associated NlpC family hydrolase